MEMPIADRYDSRSLMALGYVLTSLGFIAFYMGTYTYIALGLIIIYSAWNLRRAGFQKYFMDSTSPRLRARAVSINAIIVSIASSIGYFIASLLLVSTNQEMGILILITSGIAIIGAALTRIILPRITRPY
jgi:MFS family permease